MTAHPPPIRRLVVLPLVARTPEASRLAAADWVLALLDDEHGRIVSLAPSDPSASGLWIELTAESAERLGTMLRELGGTTAPT